MLRWYLAEILSQEVAEEVVGDLPDSTGQKDHSDHDCQCFYRGLDDASPTREQGEKLCM